MEKNKVKELTIHTNVHVSETKEYDRQYFMYDSLFLVFFKNDNEYSIQILLENEEHETSIYLNRNNFIKLINAGVSMIYGKD